MVHQEKADFREVFDVYKIPRLTAVFEIRAMRTKQFLRACLIDLIEGMKDNTGHAAFVKFIWAKYIEKFQANPEVWGRASFLLLQSPLVKLIFGCSVWIQRTEFLHASMIV